MPWFKLYNMNGRLYDPVIGRFLEPDPLVQNAGSTQNFNRYSYALNNPLRYIDPSGNSMLAYYRKNHEPYGDGYWHRGDYYSPDENGNYTGMFHGMAPTSGSNGFGSSYNYDWKNGKYYDYWGNEVSYNVVHNSYIIPRSGTDRLYGHATKMGNYNSETMIDGFKLNGVLYEFDNPVPYNNFVYASNGGGAFSGNGLQTGVGAFGVANGGKTELVDWAVRDKAGLSRNQYNKLSPARKAVLQRNAVGSAKYLKYAKGLGYVGAGVTTTITTVNAISYYQNDGTDWQVGAKASLDVIMTGVGFLGPIGFGISATYFIVDAAGGFGDFGEY
ncbi:hypothetical protein N9164_07300 [Draconibacterium sp.]|nr:hypothetical protein [Draconibacterium sp.]